MNETTNGTTSILRRVLESGARLTGSAGGAAVGLVVAGPAGAAAGAVAGQWATEELIAAGLEITERVLAPRAEARVGAVFRLADEEISVRLMAGDAPREDLRAEVTPGRNQAEELMEATLLAASESFEERKLPFVAHLLASILFEPDLTHAQAHQLIGLARDLTYRQLLILAIFAAREPFTGSLEFRGEGHEQESPDEHESTSARADLLDLFRRGLLKVSPIAYGPTSGFGSEPTGRQWPALPREMSPRDTWPTHAGKRLARMMRLDLTSTDDREDLVLSLVRRNQRR